ncbi:hypothetical protein IAT38_003289 [Cryptococcus sp. DSM 104549]
MYPYAQRTVVCRPACAAAALGKHEDELLALPRVPPGVSAPTLSSASSYSRHPSAPSPYAQFGSPHSLTSPESGHNLMALSYSSMSRSGVAVGVN